MFDKVVKGVKKAMAPKPSRAERGYMIMVRDNNVEAIEVMKQFQNRLNCLGYDIVPILRSVGQNVVMADLVLKEISYADFLKMSAKKTDAQVEAGNVPLTTEATADEPGEAEAGSEAEKASESAADDSEDAKAQAED